MNMQEFRKSRQPGCLAWLVLTLLRDFTAMALFCHNVPTHLDEMLSLCRYVHTWLKQLYHNTSVLSLRLTSVTTLE